MTWWLGRGPSADRFRELFVEPWNASQDRVRLEVEHLSTNARERTVAALESGTGPDLVMVPRAGDFVSLARRGLVADLSGYAERLQWHSRLLAPALRLATINSRLFGLPRSSETMALLTHDSLGFPLDSLADLERAADRAMTDGRLPFGAGCADFPESCELLWTLVVNHYAGPAQVRGALRGELDWDDPVFVEAISLLRSWFDQGWFGDDYFRSSIADGLDLLTTGRAAMAPVMTGLLPRTETGLAPLPFPVLRPGISSPLYVFGTASLVGINAASAVPDAAAEVLDAVFSSDVRRTFAAHEPGDWNIPLVEADAEQLRRRSPGIFAAPAVGLTEAVRDRSFGYATWSFLPPAAEAVVVAQLRPVVEGSISVREHLAELRAAFDPERSPGLD